MQISVLRHSKQLSNVARTVTIGAFDGLHLGHQQLLAKLNQVHQVGNKRALITFEPLPHEYFNAGSKPRMMSLRDKAAFLQAHDLVDELLIIPFNNAYSHMSAKDFLRSVLLKQCHMCALIVGEDFKFGEKALGDIAYLKAQTQVLGYEFYSQTHETYKNQRISSTRIRDLLAASALEDVEAMLGRKYSITGRVIYGNQLARTWGIPTINLGLRHKVLPLIGVFNVYATSCRTNMRYSGIANIGMRPTVDGKRPSLEVHLHNVNENLYGDFFKVEFISKIRDEAKFDDVNALRQQVENDVATSRAFFSL